MNLTNLISNLRRVDISNYHKLFRYHIFLKQYRTDDWLKYLNKSNLNNLQKNLIQQGKKF